MVNKKTENHVLTWKETLKEYKFSAIWYGITILFLGIIDFRVWIDPIPFRYYKFWNALAVAILPFAIYCVLVVITFWRLKHTGWARLYMIPFLLISASAVLPAMSSGNQAANHILCISNLRQICFACEKYADQHHESYPDSLEKLVQEGYIGKENLVCPGNRWHNPGDVDYEYFGKNKTRGKVDKSAVFFRDKPGNHQKKAHHSTMYFSCDMDFSCF